VADAVSLSAGLTSGQITVKGGKIAGAGGSRFDGQQIDEAIRELQAASSEAAGSDKEAIEKGLQKLIQVRQEQAAAEVEERPNVQTAFAAGGIHGHSDHESIEDWVYACLEMAEKAADAGRDAGNRISYLSRRHASQETGARA